MSEYITSLEGEYRRYKALGEAAIAQLTEEQLSAPASPGGNSVAAIVWHVAGNLESRFTGFRTSDGEKPWRNRDEEFAPRTVTRPDLLAKWEKGWRALFAALGELSDPDLRQTITIRKQPLRIDEALHRSLAHTVYHVGQIVFLAKQWCGDGWNCLSIPLGGSAAHNQRGADESAAAHARVLQRFQSIQPPPTTKSPS